MAQDPAEIERTEEMWTYPYVAAAVDFMSNLTIVVRKDSDTRVGYALSPQLQLSHTDPAVLGFFDEFCMNHGMNPVLREGDTSYRLEINRRDDLKTMLLLVQPYVLARAEVVQILLEDLIPGLEDRKQSDEAGFVELMGYVDEIREHTHGTGQRKYDQEYFKDEFDL